MVIYDIANKSLSMSNPDNILVGLSSELPLFPIMLLFFVWMIIIIGGVTRQRDREGFGDVPQWTLLSSMGVLLLSLILTIKDGIITSQTLGVVVAVTIISAIWFFMSRGRLE